jgi:DNA-binding NarL/FixJ family response regulator
VEANRAVTIIIVEDDRPLARQTQQMLETAGYTVLGIAATCEETLALCAQKLPTILLMDIGLDEGPDGIVIAERLLDLYGLRVIYLTGSDDIAQMDRAKRTRPHAYLLKPISRQQLLGAIELASALRADAPN